MSIGDFANPVKLSYKNCKATSDQCQGKTTGVQAAEKADLSNRLHERPRDGLVREDL